MESTSVGDWICGRLFTFGQQGVKKPTSRPPTRGGSHMTDHQDPWHVATILIDQHGHAAAALAARRADQLLGQGDFDGALTWQSIPGAITELQRERAPDEPLN
jgi:hypothetical protein